MYAENMQYLESNMTARSSKRFTGAQGYDNKVVVLGISGFVQEYLINSFNNNFFKRDLEEVVAEYDDVMTGIFGPGVIDTRHIRKLHTLGFLPLKVEALPEGSRVNIGVPFIRVKNTIPGYGWLVNYIETLISNYIWPMVTNATSGFEIRRLLEQAAIDTVGEANPFVVGYQAHDFSLRGLLGGRDGNIGFAHLPSFIGSDNIPGIWYAKKYYNPQGYIAGSVPATEHSVASSNILNIQHQLETKGKFEGFVRDDSVSIQQQAEEIFITKMITEKFPTGIFSYVSDTFDYWGVLTNILPRLKDVITSRVQPADSPVPTRFVVRPDSGNPVDIICGLRIYDVDRAKVDDNYSLTPWEVVGDYDCVKSEDRYFEIVPVEDDWTGNVYGYKFGKEIPEHVVKGSIELLWDLFGGTITPKGYKQLDSKIGLIYGDSINLTNLPEILERLKVKGFASTNVIIGVGSYQYQYITRDTHGQAIKATHASFETEEDGLYSIDLYKDPKTGDGEKKSAKGRLAVFKQGSDYVLKQQATEDEQDDDCFEIYFENSDVWYEPSLDEIRQRLQHDLPTP